MKVYLVDGLGVVSFIVVLYGLSFWSIPAALIVGGMAGVALAFKLG